jgi:hypothetical protein
MTSSESIRPGFWSRQFRGPVTTNQMVFDLVFGIVAPVLCFVFDPVVFRGTLLGRPLFAKYQVFVYLVSGLEIFVLATWLLFGARLSFGKEYLSGALLAGAVFCFAIGCLLMPFSLMGLMLGIGILGFTPFVTAIVYLRNASRARQNSALVGGSYVAAVLLGCVLALGAPGLLSVTIHDLAARSVDDIIHGDYQQTAAATHRLRRLRYLDGAELDRIVDTYSREADPARKQSLGDSYHAITGEDIEARIRSLD